MQVLRPDGSRLGVALARACAPPPPALPVPVALVLCAGVVEPEHLEPFVTLSRLLDEHTDGVRPALRVVVCDGWPVEGWQPHLDEALIETRLHLSGDQHKRAIEQRAADGRLDVLFVDRGVVRGSALTLVQPRRPGEPCSFDAPTSAVQVLEAAAEALEPSDRHVRRVLARIRSGPGTRLTNASQRQETARADGVDRVGRIALIELD